jgi:outer membrane protein TolC
MIIFKPRVLSRLLMFALIAGLGSVLSGNVEAAETTEGTGSEAQSDKVLPVLSETSTFEDYLTYAALSSAKLEAAFEMWKAESERARQAGYLPDPRFSYRYYIEEVETRVGPQTHAVGLSQMFPWFGKLKLRGAVAREAANAAKSRYEALKRRLFFDVEKAYCEYYYLGRSISVMEENVRLLKSLEDVVTARYKTDSARYPDLIRIQVELGKLDDRLRSLRDLGTVRSADLNAILNRPADSLLPVPQTLPGDIPEFPERSAMLGLLDQNPGLAALRHEARKAEKSISLARKEGAPDLTLGVDYIFTDEALMSDVKDSGKDPVVAMLSINIPLWRQKYRAGVEEAESRHSATLKTLEEMQNRLIADLENALYELRDAERRIELYRDTLLAKASQSLKATQQAFAAGKASFIEVIDSLRVLLEFQLAHERARVDRIKAAASLRMLLGDISAESARE